MIPTTTADWTAWEPDRDIDSCCAWAESVIFTAAIKNQFDELGTVESEWFGQWKDRVLWEGMRTVIAANDGVFEPLHVRDWLFEREPGYAQDLLETLADYGDLRLRDEALSRAVGTLRRAGERRMVMRWAQEIIELCQSAAPITSIRDLARQTPVTEGGAV